ncbi:sodium bicarbonate transporter family protein [Mycobacterium gordonae]|uniref:sodium bicarbonate transporter family protein n=1 Tax=Mycobacterium gordonae TaxID=1778 RepID=UPI000ACAC28D|nr:sodium bicarbonate transporter family protein [Mycobacterium gordonae]MCQ4363974.1 sodium bicarbonate transporter family protein [Mycobacterium gordonae]
MCFELEGESVSSKPSSVSDAPQAPEVGLLTYTGRLGGGLWADVQRKLPFYTSDFKDGLHPKAVASVSFLFFACLANAIAFGGLTSVMTDGEIGIVEMIVATAVGGILFALLSAQPLTILGGTGPIVIFTGLLYTMCRRFDLPFLPVYAWVGVWSGVLMLVLAVTDASALMRFFTRFVDEIFAVLIAVIFIVEAARSVASPFTASPRNDATALMTVVLALGTFLLARNFKTFLQTRYIQRRFREFVADFGPTIAIALMTIFALTLPEVKVADVAIPDHFGTTTGRPWLVDMFSVPVWLIFACLGPAILVTVLLFLDQNITTRLVNSPSHALRKGGGYHLDLAVVGVITAVCSVFGLPWIVAATVHSLNHVKSLATTTRQDDDSGAERILAVRENRVSPLAIHILIAASLFMLPLIKTIPIEVLFGLFLFMGFATLNGTDFYARLKLWLTDRNLYPDTHYVRHVPWKVIHLFTLVQVLCLVVLWILKSSPAGILFPLFIAMLVPFRLLLNKWFQPQHLALLDADEQAGDDSMGDFRP